MQQGRKDIVSGRCSGEKEKKDTQYIVYLLVLRRIDHFLQAN